MSRILVVEDSPEVLEVLLLALEGQGHDTIGAMTCADAETLLAHQSFDLIVIDLVLPDCDGMSLLPSTDQPMVGHILMTGDEIAAARLNDQGYRCLAKPFPPEAFIEAVGAVLNNAPTKAPDP